MMQNTHIQLKKLIYNKLSEFNNNSRKVISFLKTEGLWDCIVNSSTSHYKTDGEYLYNFQYINDKLCPDGLVSFVSFAVGYRFCSPTCNCCISSKSQTCTSSKQALNDDEKSKIQKKRETTNFEKYGYVNYFNNSEQVKQDVLKKHGVDNVRKIPGVSEKIKKTCIEKYGVDNPAKNKEIQLKTAKAWQENAKSHIDTFKELILCKYGVDNIRKIPGVSEKIKKTCIEKYGVDNVFKLSNVQLDLQKKQREQFFNNLASRVNNLVIPLFTIDEYIGTSSKYLWKCSSCNYEFLDTIINGRIPICRKCNPYSISKVESELHQLLVNQTVNFNSREIIPPKEIDCYLPFYQLAVECNGVYWHSELQGKDKNYHLYKTIKCEEKNIHLLQIWDTEWYSKKDIVISIINSYLKNNTKIFARKGIIKPVSNKDKTSFLIENHLQGDAASSVNIGLYINNNLTALMTFGKSRYNKAIEWELVRYCQLKNTNVVGGGSKLFSYFLKNYLPNSIITYADRRWFSGNLYKHLGFTFSHNSAPSYFYFSLNNPSIVESRIKYQKHKQLKLLKTFDNNLTEWENMKNNNYSRIWDCGNSVWIYKKEQ